MTATIIRIYTFGIDDYCHIRYGDNTSIELSQPAGTFTTDQEWIDLALQLYDLRPDPPDPMLQILMCCPDDILVAEVLRRHLIITVEGGQV